MTTGKQTREFNYVADLVDGFLLAAVVPDIEGELFNLGCGEEVSMRDLATTILDLMGNPIEAEFGALPDRPIEIWRMYCDATRAREPLGWKPRPQPPRRPGRRRSTGTAPSSSAPIPPSSPGSRAGPEASPGPA